MASTRQCLFETSSPIFPFAPIKTIFINTPALLLPLRFPVPPRLRVQPFPLGYSFILLKTGYATSPLTKPPTQSLSRFVFHRHQLRIIRPVSQGPILPAMKKEVGVASFREVSPRPIGPKLIPYPPQQLREERRCLLRQRARPPCAIPSTESRRDILRAPSRSRFSKRVLDTGPEGVSFGELLWSHCSCSARNSNKRCSTIASPISSFVLK